MGAIYPNRIRVIHRIRDSDNKKPNKAYLFSERAALSQRFDAATCLIDFSRSALVALWFACQQGSTGEANGKVYAIRHDDMVRLKTVNPDSITKEIDYFLKPDENGRHPLYQWQPKLQNNRIIAQQSVFVFSGFQFEPGVGCVIKKESKQEMLAALDKISGITEATIYPDFDGFSRLHAHNKPYIEPDAQDYLQRGTETHQEGNLDDMLSNTILKSYSWNRQTPPYSLSHIIVEVLLTVKKVRLTAP